MRLFPRTDFPQLDVTRLGIAAIAVTAIFVGAQLVAVARTNPAVRADVAAPPEIAVLLRHACYDCHSHETAWPWYSRVAPVSWFIVYDVEEGRRALDFSAWGTYDRAQRAKLLRESADEIAEGEMAPWYYRLVHPDARLTAAEQEAIRAWCAARSARLGD